MWFNSREFWFRYGWKTMIDSMTYFLWMIYLRARMLAARAPHIPSWLPCWLASWLDLTALCRCVHSFATSGCGASYGPYSRPLPRVFSYDCTSKRPSRPHHSSRKDGGEMWLSRCCVAPPRYLSWLDSSSRWWGSSYGLTPWYGGADCYLCCWHFVNPSLPDDSGPVT